MHVQISIKFGVALTSKIRPVSQAQAIGIVGDDSVHTRTARPCDFFRLIGSPGENADSRTVQGAHKVRTERVHGNACVGGLRLQGKGDRVDGHAFKKRNGFGRGIVATDNAKLRMQKRGVENRMLKSALAHCAEDVLGRAGLLDFQHQTWGTAGGACVAVDGLQNFGECRDGLVTGHGTQLPDFIERSFAYISGPGGGTLQEAVVEDDELSVAGALDIHFHQVDAEAQGGDNGGDRVAGRHMTSGAAVADAKIRGKARHEAIMNDSSTIGAESRRVADPQSLSRLERWYEKRCEPVSEVCIVPLPDGSSAPAHLHAVVVPDFAWLREWRRPNARELIRFEFQKVSKLLAPDARPQTFSIRAHPLPRTANGELDRERLRMDLSQLADCPCATAENDALRDAVCALIRGLRPAACPREGANLELDLGFDSLDRILLVCSVEQTFGIAISAEQAARIFTVGDLISVSRSRQLGTDAPITSSAVSSWTEILRHPLNAQERSVAESILKPRTAFSLLAWSAAQMLRIAAARRFRFEVQGREWLPAQGAYLLVANHCSHLDPLFLVWALPFSMVRRLSFMGHTEYFGAGWKAAVATRLKLVPVDTDEHALEGIRLCAEALRRGLIGAVFPEGERSPDGAQQRFHRGIALLAIALNVPIVPVGVAGTYEVLPRGGQHIRWAPVQVRFGAPVRAERGETEQDLLARVWVAVSKLRGGDARSREPIPRPIDICTGNSA